MVRGGASSTYSITYTNSDVTGPSSASEGETVTVTTENTEWFILYVFDTTQSVNENTIYAGFENGTATFVMPSHDVYATAYPNGGGN